VKCRRQLNTLHDLRSRAERGALSAFHYYVLFVASVRETERVVAMQKGKTQSTVILYLTKYRTMKSYWGSEGIAPRILNLVAGWR
jgi:hypothetical protein